MITTLFCSNPCSNIKIEINLNEALATRSPFAAAHNVPFTVQGASIAGLFINLLSGRGSSIKAVMYSEFTDAKLSLSKKRKNKHDFQSKCCGLMSAFDFYGFASDIIDIHILREVFLY